MPEAGDLSREAGEQFDFGVALGFEDAMQRRFRYHLLRLTTAGLRREEVEHFVELGRLAFQGADVSQQVAKIKQRADSSSLGFAIADIVGAAEGRSAVSLRAAMMGTLLGAYAALRSVQGIDENAAAIIGAIGGAVATSASSFISESLGEPDIREYFKNVD
jgi:hypothetical protein